MTKNAWKYILTIMLLARKKGILRLSPLDHPGIAAVLKKLSPPDSL